MFEVPTTKASKDQDKFSFKIGAQSFKIKRVKYLTIAEQITIANTETLEQRVEAIFGPAGSKIGDAVLGLVDDQFDALMDAYNADSEVTPGESEGSSTSSATGSSEKPSSTT